MKLIKNVNMFLILLLVLLLHSSFSLQNTRPIIGILSQPSSWPKIFDPDEFSYIAASYVKFLEAAGARVIPLKYDMNRQNLTKLLLSINGLLIPGGGTDLIKETHDKFNISKKKTEKSEFFETGEFLISLAREINEKGDYFPVWGTCLGYELMVMSIANDSSNVLSMFNSTNHSMKLKFLKNALTSKMFGGFQFQMKAEMSREPFQYFNHKFGLDVKDFNVNKNLRSFFRPLTINEDKNGRVFISAVEGKNMPFYGVQFHPEKNSFEWKEHLEINHSPESIEIEQKFAYFFVNEARKNFQNFSSIKEEKKELISNYYPLPLSESFVNVYIFSKPTRHELFKVNVHSKKFQSFIQNFINIEKNHTSSSNSTANSTIIDDKNENNELKNVNSTIQIDEKTVLIAQQNDQPQKFEKEFIFIERIPSSKSEKKVGRLKNIDITKNISKKK